MSDAPQLIWDQTDDGAPENVSADLERLGKRRPLDDDEWIFSVDDLLTWVKSKSDDFGDSTPYLVLRRGAHWNGPLLHLGWARPETTIEQAFRKEREERETKAQRERELAKLAELQAKYGKEPR